MGGVYISNSCLIEEPPYRIALLVRRRTPRNRIRRQRLIS
jgi:hypothetical protein